MSLILGSKQESLFVECHLSILNPLEAALGVYVAFLGLLVENTSTLVGLPSTSLYCALMKGVGVFRTLFFILDLCAVLFLSWLFLALLIMMCFEDTGKLSYGLIFWEDFLIVIFYFLEMVIFCCFQVVI